MPNKRRTGIRSWLSRIGLVVLALALALVLGEILVRIVASQQTFAIRNTPWGFGHVPNITLLHRGDNGNVIRVRYNRFGLRNRELSLTKPPGVFRIAVFGDSWLEDLGSVEHNLMPRHLERLLNQAGLGKKFQVINFGHYAFDNAQELMLYLKLGRKFKPDLVIVCYANDVRENIHYARVDASGKLKLLWRHHTWWQNFTREIKTFFRSRSHLAILVLNALDSLRRRWGDKTIRQRDRYLALPADHPKVQKLKKQLQNDPERLKQALSLVLASRGVTPRMTTVTEAIFKRFQQEVRRDGAKFLVVNVWTNPHPPSLPMYFQKQHISYLTVDLKPFAAYLKKLRQRPYDPEMDSDRWGYGANELVARIILKRLVQDKMVPISGGQAPVARPHLRSTPAR